MKRKRIVWVLLAALPLILFRVVREKASWKPQMLLAIQGPPSYFLAHSNAFAFSRRSGGYSEPEILKVISFDSPTRTAIYSVGDNTQAVSFISDNQAVIWKSVRPDDRYRNQDLHAQILDCQQMKTVRRLETVVSENKEVNYSSGAGFISEHGIIYVEPLRAFEWSLETGRLLRHWDLHKAGDDTEVVNTVYDAQRHTFVQTFGAKIRFWDARSGRLLRTLKTEFNGTDRRLRIVAFAPDFDFLVIYDVTFSPPAGRFFAIIRCADGKTLWTTFNSSDQEDISEVALTADGKELWVSHPRQMNFTVHNALNGQIVRHVTAPYYMPDFWLSPDDYWLYYQDMKYNLWRRRAY